MDLKKIKKFLNEDIWRLDHENYGKHKGRALKYLKITLFAKDNVGRKKIGLCGVALAFFSIMAFIPGVALAFAVTNGFGIDEKLTELLLSCFSGQEELVQMILGYANNILSVTSNGIFGVVTFLSFVWLVFWLMIQVENSFNYVWNKAQKSRAFWKRVCVYVALALILPFVIIMFLGTSLMFTNGNGLVSLLVTIPFWDQISGLLSWLIMYGVVVLVLSLMFKFIPSAKVRFNHALHSAMVTAIFFCGFQFIYVTAQIAFNRWNTVFGAVAAIPFLMVWLNVSWQIVLYGAELTYSFQHVDGQVESVSDGELPAN